jgi:hypothetical protein
MISLCGYDSDTNFFSSILLLRYLLIFPLYFFILYLVTWTDHLMIHVTLGQVILTMTHRLLGLYYRFQTLSHDDSF